MFLRIFFGVFLSGWGAAGLVINFVRDQGRSAMWGWLILGVGSYLLASALEKLEKLLKAAAENQKSDQG